MPVLGLATLFMALVLAAVAFDIWWYVAIDGCTVAEAWQQLTTHRDAPAVCP